MVLGSSRAVAKATFTEFFKDTGELTKSVLCYYRRNSIIFPPETYVIARKTSQHCKIVKLS